MAFHFAQWQDPDSKTFTYCIGCKKTGHALLIDSVLSQLDFYLNFFEASALTLRACLETHIHADHLTAAFNLREITGCEVVYSHLAPICTQFHPVKEGEYFSCGTLDIKVLETPGHTDHDLTFVCEDRLFTGDCLLIQGCGRTDFQSGSSPCLWHSITEKLFSFPNETLIYPGHDYNNRFVSCIGQEKALNPRLAGQTCLSFQEIMRSLTLPHPKMIDIAVPFNRAGVAHPCPPRG